MRRRTLMWIAFAVLLVVGGIVAYVLFLLSPPDPAESAERVDLCEKIVLAALDSPPNYRRMTTLEMRQLVIPRVVAIVYRVESADAPASSAMETATCTFANPFNSTYGRPGMIQVMVRGGIVAQSLVDAEAAKWAAGRH